jgi:hypothetical protein
MISSKTCANCGITYAAHFEHPERCGYSDCTAPANIRAVGPRWRDADLRSYPARWRTSSGP